MDSAVTAADKAIASAAQARSEGAVIVGGAPTRAGLVKEILADSGIADNLTTVSDGQAVVGQVTVPLALNSRIGGTNGHYGIGGSLAPLPATSKLAPLNRSAVPSGNAG